MGDLVIGVAFLLLSILVYAASGDFPSFGEAHLSAGSFPRMIVVFLGLLSCVLIVESSRSLFFGKRPGEKERESQPRRRRHRRHIEEYKYVYLSSGIFLLYVVLMKYIGFRISTFLFILGSSYLLSPRRKSDLVIATVLAAVITLGSYYFFQRVLNVRFPRGFFEN